MNLREFTEIVDQKAGERSRSELLVFLHSIARKVPEEKREEFIGILEGIRGDAAGEESRPPETVMKMTDEKEIRKEFGRLAELFGRIEEGELTLHADGYEDYSRGYSDSWVWEYEDEQAVGRVYEDAGRLIQRCVNDGVYRLAVEMFDLFSDTQATVENDWEDFEMGVQKLAQEHLAALNLENLALYALYAAYQDSEPKERAKNLYVYFSIPFFGEIHVEDMLSLGREELQDQSAFWDSWIQLLSAQAGDIPARLLREAVSYQHGEKGMLEFARLSYRTHPSLYLEALDGLERAHDYLRQLEAGQEALEKVGRKYILRSRIALKTAEAAIRLEKEEEAERCLLEAFASWTVPVGYLRILCESRDPEAYREETKRIILSAGRGHEAGSNTRVPAELQENLISGYQADILGFLSGDFDAVMGQCLGRDRPLGWTGSFVKCGIAMFLLLLLEGEDWKPGCLKMAENLLHYLDFRAEEYYCGTKHQVEYAGKTAVPGEDMELFGKCFQRWKAGYHLTQEKKQEYLSKLEGLIDGRIEAVVSGQHRGSYRGAAALAAALGEVKESMGQAGEKQCVMQKYKERFPRHSSFHGELRAFGMKDTRKNKR